MKSRDEYPRAMQLAGGFSCELTQAEAMQWDDYIIPNPLWSENLSVNRECELVMARIKGGESGLVEMAKSLLVRRDLLHHELYRVSRDWYVKLVASLED